MFKIRSLTKSFGQRCLFHRVNLDLTAGKVYALVGKSGSGKTTLLNILSKLETYDSGDISYQGQDFSSISSKQFFRHHLGYLFQNFGLLDNQSVFDNLELGLVGQKLNKSEKQETMTRALTEVGLDYLDLNQKIFELSGGEAQRIALAKLILKNPPLIFADEPTAALDPKTSESILDLLMSFRRPDCLIVIATHDPLVWQRADEIIFVDRL